VNTVWKAPDLSGAALIHMRVSKPGVISLHTKIGLLHGGDSVGARRLVEGHGPSLKQCIGASKYVLWSLLSDSMTNSSLIACPTGTPFVQVCGSSGPNPILAAFASSQVASVANVHSQLKEYISGTRPYSEDEISGALAGRQNTS
jgi:hypothetical protein